MASGYSKSQPAIVRIAALDAAGVTDPETRRIAMNGRRDER